MYKSLLTMTAALAALSVGVLAANASPTNASPRPHVASQDTARTTHHARRHRNAPATTEEFSSRSRADEFRGVHAPRK
jgi:hypothetical protein